MMQRMLFGPPKGVPADAHDLPWYEATGMAILVAFTILFGVLPFLLVNLITSSPIHGFPGT
jgi:NADH:ubiquinone oxidoreductase subunit 4 (subunit M)